MAPQKPLKEDAPVVDIEGVKLSSPPSYKIGENVATRFAYGTALAKIAANNSRVIALDGDTKNSTYSDRLKKVSFLHFSQCFLPRANGILFVSYMFHYFPVYAWFFQVAFFWIFL